MTTSDGETPPARGTRPRNRRALIIAAATELFHDVGYTKVGMGDIAGAVNVQPSALYRHFSGKDELFVAAAHAALEPAKEILSTSDGDLDELLRALSRTGAGQRAVGVLWQREARHLPDNERDLLRAELAGVAALLAGHLRRERPALDAPQADLLAWSALAALASISFHRLQLPSAQFEACLYDILQRILRTEIAAPDSGPQAATGAGLAVHSRRETILAVSVQLFAAHGFASVTVDDIGEAAGIAGPSVYNYFASKQDLLTASLDRLNGWLWTELSRALAAAEAEPDALSRLLDSYLSLAMERGDLISALIGDQHQLPDPDRHRVRQAQHDYITEWVVLLQAVRPELETTAARIQVQAALMIVNDTAQTPHLRRLPGFAAALKGIVGSLLAP